MGAEMARRKNKGKPNNMKCGALLFCNIQSGTQQQQQQQNSHNKRTVWNFTFVSPCMKG
jgi:hypothetical protein